MIAACNSFFNEDKSLADINNTLIVLIPKKKVSTRMVDFRPISLCNVLYKIISKVLANRLKQVLPLVIDDNQSAFVPNRQILDNAIVAFETIHNFKRRTGVSTGAMAIKLDMSKAYDRVEWPFLEAVMCKLGFCDKWRKWINRCVSSVNYSILINGQVTDSFKPSRGLRQGDPLSPYLFLFCAEGFSAMLHRCVQAGTIHGQKISRFSPPISHLFFADDSLIFCKANTDESWQLKQVLVAYELASGQKVNFEKSAIYFSPNVSNWIRAEINSILNITSVTCHDRYLGIPTIIGRRKIETFESIKARVWAKLNGWKERCFSKGGKEILIKAVAQSIPNYFMSCFRLPQAICADINHMIARFWWGASTEGNKIHWLSWKKLCRPKSQGGLGFRDLELFNKALLAKQGWRIISNPDSLACKVLKGKYFNNGDFLSASVGSDPSFVWRSLMWGRDLLKLGLRWRIGDGSKVNIFENPWIPRPSLFRPVSPRTAYSPLLVKDLILPSGSWDINLVSQVLPLDVDDVLAIPINAASDSDCLVWHYDSRGCYSVKSGYFLGLAGRSTGAGSSSNSLAQFWKKLWHSRLPRKILIFGWRALNNALPISSLLRLRGVCAYAGCARCGRIMLEDPCHVFFECPKSKQVWLCSSLRDCWAELRVLNFWDALAFVWDYKDGTLASLFLVLCWFIWWDRNSVLFGGRGLEAEALVVKATSFLNNFEAIHGVRATNRDSAMVKWNKPSGRWVRFNSDAAISCNLKARGIGFVGRDSNGDAFVAGAKHFVGSFSVDISEALGVLEAVKLAISRDLRQVEFESDCQVVVNLLNSSVPSRNELGGIIENIKSKSCGRDFIFRFVPRSGNKVAHSLAHFALSIDDSEIWVSLYPEWLLSLIRNDIS